MPLLEIDNLSICFHPSATRVVEGFSLRVAAGEAVALVGESGCGKSVTALSIARLVPSPPAVYVSGEIRVAGRDTLKMPPAQLRQIRGGTVSYIFQEPSAALNPVMRIGNQIRELLRLHQPQWDTPAEVIRLLESVGIPAPATRARQYAHELSGGMQQRVMIAMALASRPKLLVADEPTTALDATIQAQILDLLDDLRKRLGMSLLLITHNLGIAGRIAPRIAVMYAGQMVEEGPSERLLARPAHPYSQGLLESAPRLGRDTPSLKAIPGQVPRGDDMPVGCRFHPRCAQAQPDCAQTAPALISVGDRWLARCPYARRANES
jgi:peptide/nickel transport system ATP-binding protein